MLYIAKYFSRLSWICSFCELRSLLATIFQERSIFSLNWNKGTLRKTLTPVCGNSCHLSRCRIMLVDFIFRWIKSMNTGLHNIVQNCQTYLGFHCVFSKILGSLILQTGICYNARGMFNHKLSSVYSNRNSPTLLSSRLFCQIDLVWTSHDKIFSSTYVVLFAENASFNV